MWRAPCRPRRSRSLTMAPSRAESLPAKMYDATVPFPVSSPGTDRGPVVFVVGKNDAEVHSLLNIDVDAIVNLVQIRQSSGDDENLPQSAASRTSGDEKSNRLPEEHKNSRISHRRLVQLEDRFIWSRVPRIVRTPICPWNRPASIKPFALESARRRWSDHLRTRF